MSNNDGSLTGKTINAVTGNLANDLIDAIQRKISTSAPVTKIRETLQKDLIHNEARDLLAHALSAALKGTSLPGKMLKVFLDDPQNRTQIINWILNDETEIPDDIFQEFNIEDYIVSNRERDKCARFLKKLFREIQTRKRRTFSAENLNILSAIHRLEDKFTRFMSPGNLEVLPDDLLQTVRQSNRHVREGLEPNILPRVSRWEVREKYVPAILRGLDGTTPRIVPLIGSAGFGKSTILGDIYDRLLDQNIGWLALLRCNDLTLPQEPARDDLAIAFGEALLDRPIPLHVIIQAMTKDKGAGVVLIDTLDLILSNRIVPLFRKLLINLVETGATVAFTCRDFDYAMFIDPVQEKLAGLIENIDRYHVTHFSREEVEIAAVNYARSVQQITDIEQANAFAKALLDLSADNRSLQQIVHNPLLLAMLCDLYGPGKYIPSDLTVSSLYDSYWRERISKSRRFSALSAEKLYKEKICLQLAQHLFQVSRHRLYETLSETDWTVEVNPISANARAELLSDGVLKTQSGGTIRFFHQTFLEYAIARWLTTHSGAFDRKSLLKLDLNREDQHYWWPVIRQMLTICPEDIFQESLEMLDYEQLPGFRTVSFAAASRPGTEKFAILGTLLQYANQQGFEYQKTLLQTLELIHIQHFDRAWEIILQIIQFGEKSIAIVASRAAGPFLERMARQGIDIAPYVVKALRVIDLRNISTIEDPSAPDIPEIFGRFIEASYPVLKEYPTSHMLAILREKFGQFGNPTRSAVINLHLSERVAPEQRLELLKLLFQSESPAELKAETTQLLQISLPMLWGDAATVAREDVWTLLLKELPSGWDIILPRAVGRWIVDHPTFMPVLINALFTRRMEQLSRIRIAISEAIRNGGGQSVCTALTTFPIQDISPERHSILADILQELAQEINATYRTALLNWAAQIPKDSEWKLLQALLALADPSDHTVKLMTDYMKNISDVIKIDTLYKLLKTHPEKVSWFFRSDDTETFLLRDASQKSKKTLIKLYAYEAEASSQALLKLIQLAALREQSTALAASAAIVKTIIHHHEVPFQPLLNLARSPYAGVRVNFVQAIIQRFQQPQNLTQTDLTDIFQLFQKEETDSVLRVLCQLARLWVLNTGSIPEMVADYVGQIAPRMAQREKFDGGLARSVISVLKPIAQLEDYRFREKCGVWCSALLEAIDINRVTHGLSETIDLISASLRMNPAYAAELIQLSPSLPVKNVRAIVTAIRRVAGANSEYLSEVMHAEWCPAEIRNTILAFRGI